MKADNIHPESKTRLHTTIPISVANFLKNEGGNTGKGMGKAISRIIRATSEYKDFCRTQALQSLPHPEAHTAPEFSDQ